MTELSIKVVIGGRSYPLTINPEEEELIRKAARMIEDRIRNFEENYSVIDKQDLLAMCALQYANKLLLAEENSNVENEDDIMRQLDLTTGLIEDYLEKV
jgi:cell division protein ZapA (FtsZ GTPase activity inhibitor)